MTWNGVSVLAVVPARGGSKGIPRKNLQTVGGISLVGHAGSLCGTLNWLDAAVLSTDDDEIAEEGRAYGLSVPFIRPSELASDGSGSVEMWRHAWLASEQIFGRTFEASILLEPTSPLRNSDDIQRTVSAVIDDGAIAAATVSRIPAHFTPNKTLLISEDGEIRFYLEHGARFSTRQCIPTYYHRNGLCYCVRRKHLVVDSLIIDKACQAIVINRPVVNIDEPIELLLAEWLYQRANLT